MTKPSKYETLAQWLRTEISNGALPPGSRVHSENELCRMFGVSRQTVRQAVGRLEQEGLLVRRRGSGTYVSDGGGQAPRPGRYIGVMMTYLDSYIFPSIVSGIERTLAASGYGMLLAMTHNRTDYEARSLQNFWENRVAGLIVEPAKSGLPSANLGLYSRLQAGGLPMIFINAAHPQLGIPCVRMDDRAAGYMAAEHLIKMGHRTLAGMFKVDDRQGHLRYEGYVAALQRAGLPLSDERVLWFTTEDIPCLGQDMGRIMRYIKDASGLVCYNDSVARQLCQELASRGIDVPGQLSVVSIDDADIAAMGGVGLTTLAHPSRVLGQTAAANLIGLIQNPSIDAEALLMPRLVERESVRRPD